MLNSKSFASKLIDFIRFFAALSVVVKHVGATMGLSVPPVYQGNNIQYFYKTALYYWTLSGYKFVMVFFVLSGFFISSSVIKMLKNGTWSWKMYLNNRLTRLWVVLFPALILTKFWNSVSYYFFGTNYPSGSGKLTFLENLFFLQGIKGISIYGHNGPLWSLSYEFWYYILFPCLILIFITRPVLLKVLYGVLFLCISYLVGLHVLAYFFIWLLGAAVAMLPKVRIHSLVCIPLFIGSIILCGKSMFSFYQSLIIFKGSLAALLPDLDVGICFSLLLYIIVIWWNDYIVDVRFFSHLASFSYTLYLVHYPVLDLIGILIPKSAQLAQKDFYDLYIYLVGFLVLYAWVVSQFTEKHTNKVRMMVLTHLTQRKKGLELKSNFNH